MNTQGHSSMTKSRQYPLPDSWQALEHRSPERADILAALHEHRAEMLRYYAMVPLPSDGLRGITRVGALLTLWSRWDYMRGACPNCQGEALAHHLTGAMNIGTVAGCCISCGTAVHRCIGGMGHIERGRLFLRDTPYKLPFLPSFPGGWRMAGKAIALIAVLQELGAHGLPDRHAFIWAPELKPS